MKLNRREFFKGFIDEVSIYDRLTSVEEVQQNLCRCTRVTVVSNAKKIALTRSGKDFEETIMNRSY